MKTGKGSICIVSVLCLFVCFSSAGETSSVIIDAMSDELARSMKSLKIEDMERPYYLEYSILDKWTAEVEAGFGSLTKSTESHNRELKVELRVGDYQLDNTGFLSRSSMFASGGGGSRSTVLEDDYNAIRHDLWLATDSAYKQALEQLAAKKGFIKNNVQSEETADFSKQKSEKLLAPREIQKIDRAKWEKIIKTLSTLFRKYPGIHESAVKLYFQSAHRYYVNSEGTVFCKPEHLVSIVAHGTTQAPDGMKLKHYFPIYASKITDLPGEAEIAAGIRKMAEELTALTKAPVIEDYIGPVLFTKQASAELFARMLAPHFSGERPPLSSEPRLSQSVFSSKLTQRINRRVLPREISISDDPTRDTFKKNFLLGSYLIDDQGIKPKPVKLVESGVLKTLLMSRRPRKDISNSNGHARSGVRGQVGVQIGNLFVTAEKGKSYKELKKELIELCKEQQMSHGLIIKTVDNPAVTGMDFSVASLIMSRSQSGPQMTNPVLMYRVRVKDGREELVRGITFSEIDLRSFKDIVTVGNDHFVHHRLMSSGGSANPMMIFFRGRSGSPGTPASIVAPSVLVEELEFKKSAETRKNPPLLGHPFFLK